MKKICAVQTQLGLVLLCSLCAMPGLRADETGHVFATPQEAARALGRTVNSTNRDAFTVLFGSDARELANPDTVQGAQELAEFAAAFNVTNRWVHESDARWLLEVGQERWPFPIPLAKRAGGWQFDTAAGREEIRNRRIGRNELDVLRVLRACVQAQRDYASRDRDGDEVLEFAQKFASAPDRMDGLYWPVELNGEISPLGPLVAFAHDEGYSRKASAIDAPQPFHGYLFKLLTRQGKHAPGGKHDYVINGNMIGGFAFVAWPAEYGESGIMTFIVNQQGRVYQKRLGRDTEKVVRKMNAYDPDSSWQPSID
jgi:hypothetical protein